MKSKFRLTALLFLLISAPLTASADDEDSTTVSASRLEMPNAFSPNGDGINDLYRAKDNHENIATFHAYIFNRWGQRLYEWTDIDGGWDGTYKGHPVKDGVYYVRVRATGGDGREYDIKKDVNLLRKFNEVAGSYEQ